MTIELRERLYDIDDLWTLYHQPENEGLRFELIDGVLIEMSAPGGEHGAISINLGFYLRSLLMEQDIGIATAGTGYHPPGNRHTLLVPDVAFISHGRAPNPFPRKLVPVMPDLAVEIHSPSNTRSELREKAQRYLRLGTALVWLVFPDEQRVEVCRHDDSGKMTRKVLGADDHLSGEDALPGFRLAVGRVFE